MKYVYWITTGFLSAIILFSAGMYIFNNAYVAEEFTALGFPTWIIYPLAAVKVLAIATILTRKFKALTEWAYAGLFFNTLLAFGAHLVINDGEQWGALMACIFTLVSYFTGKKVRK